MGESCSSASADLSCHRCPPGARPAHALELVAGLYGPIEVQACEQLSGIHGLRFGVWEAVAGTNEGHPPELGPVHGGTGRVRHWGNLDGRRPWFLRQARRLVPKIVGLMEQYPQPRPRGINGEALRIVHNGYPGLEMRIHLVGIVLVVQELD